MAIVYPTSTLDAKERFDYWQDVVCSTYAPTANRKLTDDQFDGSLDVTVKGGVSFSRIKSLPIEYNAVSGMTGTIIILYPCPCALMPTSISAGVYLGKDQEILFCSIARALIPAPFQRVTIRSS